MKIQNSRSSIKNLMLVGILILTSNLAFSQCEIIKTNLSTYIKTGLLAPTSFKIHRYSCEQISPPVQKLQTDLKKKENNSKE